MAAGACPWQGVLGSWLGPRHCEWPQGPISAGVRSSSSIPGRKRAAAGRGIRGAAQRIRGVSDEAVLLRGKEWIPVTCFLRLSARICSPSACALAALSVVCGCLSLASDFVRVFASQFWGPLALHSAPMELSNAVHQRAEQGFCRFLFPWCVISG